MEITESLKADFKNHIKSVGGDDIRELVDSHGFISLVFDIDINNRVIPLKVKLVNKMKWLSLPRVLVRECDLPALAHIGNDGLICISDHQGEMFNNRDLIGLFKFAIDTAIQILTTSTAQYNVGNRQALYEELEGYNQTIINDISSIVATHNLDDSNLVYAWCINETRQRNTPPISHIKYLVDGLSKNPPKSSPYTAYRVTRISLETVNDFIIPKIFEGFDIDWWEQQLSNVDNEKLKELNKTSGYKVVLLEVPTPKMPTYLVISYYKDMLLPSYRDLKVQSLQRGWRDYLLNRTGIDRQSSNMKTVVIAGCGSVGSRVAEILAESDIDKIILIDYDVMKTDNVMRHYLGISDVNKSKVYATRYRLKSNIPEIKVEAIKGDILNWLSDQTAEQLDELHSIVLTTGHPPTELEVCQYLYNMEVSVHVVSGWLEAYGLGAHVLGFNSGKDSCLKCLYYDESGNTSNYINTRLFDNPKGLILSKNITGCVGAFTAYGSVHAMKTAVSIAEFVIDNKVGLQSWCSTSKSPNDYQLEPTIYFDTVSQNGGYHFKPLDMLKIAGCSCCST